MLLTVTTEGIVPLPHKAKTKGRDVDRMIRAMGKEHGFEVICVWQPAVYTKDPRTEREEQWAKQFEMFEDLIYALLTAGTFGWLAN